MARNISKITINASVQRVWDVLTKPKFVKLWQYGSDLKTTWEIGNKIEFVTEWEGQVFKQWGKVLEIHQNEMIKYSLFAPSPDLEDNPENYFVMTYVLKSENGNTNLEIIQEDTRPNAIQEEEQGEENPFLKLLREVAESK